MRDGLKKLSEIPLKMNCTIQSVERTDKIRFYDLGFYKGSKIIPMYQCTPMGTRVYLVKDTMIALRDMDSQSIIVEEEGIYE